MASEQRSQTYANHARFDPIFHFILQPVFLANFIFCVVRLVRSPTLWRGWLAIVALAAILALLLIRVYALKVQDRVIRLEEQLRLQRILPPALLPRIEELSQKQLIALRFASHQELPLLVEKTLAGPLTPKQIKQAIQVWRPDYSRV